MSGGRWWPPRGGSCRVGVAVGRGDRADRVAVRAVGAASAGRCLRAGRHRTGVLGHGPAVLGASSIYKGADGFWHGRVTVGVRDDGRPDPAATGTPAVTR